MPSKARKGYWLNQFCMSLMKADNRARFKADERAYLDEWPDDRRAEAGRAGARPELVMRTGGNIYFLAKIGATDGLSFQQMAGSMTGMTEEEYRDMMLSRRPHRPRATAIVGEDGDAQARSTSLQGCGGQEQGA